MVSQSRNSTLSTFSYTDESEKACWTKKKSAFTAAFLLEITLLMTSTLSFIAISQGGLGSLNSLSSLTPAGATALLLGAFILPCIAFCFHTALKEEHLENSRDEDDKTHSSSLSLFKERTTIEHIFPLDSQIIQPEYYDALLKRFANDELESAHSSISFLITHLSKRIEKQISCYFATEAQVVFEKNLQEFVNCTKDIPENTLEKTYLALDCSQIEKLNITSPLLVKGLFFKNFDSEETDPINELKIVIDNLKNDSFFPYYLLLASPKVIGSVLDYLGRKEFLQKKPIDDQQLIYAIFKAMNLKDRETYFPRCCLAEKLFYNEMTKKTIFEPFVYVG